MNSFALLQDEVEDDGADVTIQESTTQGTPTYSGIPATESDTHLNKANGTSVDKDHVQDNLNDGDQGATTDKPGEDSENKDKAEEAEEKSLTLDEYFAQKASLSKDVANLTSGGPRQANNGQDGFAKMSVLKKKEERDDETMTGVAVKEMHEAKGLKDSTHATVARNAEIQKFFKRDPNERRPPSSYRGRGRGGGPDRGRGRGNASANYERGNNGNNSGPSNGERGSAHGGGFVERGNGRGSERGGRGASASGFVDRGGRGGFNERGGGRGGYSNSNGRGGYSNGNGNFERGGRFGSERGGRGRGGRGGYERGGRGGYGGRGEGRGRGRGSYRGGYDRSMSSKNNVVGAPKLDDISAFPSL